MDIGFHAFVVLVEHDAFSEQFAEEHEGGVFEKSQPMAGDGEVTGIGAKPEQLPKRLDKGS